VVRNLGLYEGLALALRVRSSPRTGRPGLTSTAARLVTGLSAKRAYKLTCEFINKFKAVAQKFQDGKQLRFRIFEQSPPPHEEVRSAERRVEGRGETGTGTASVVKDKEEDKEEDKAGDKDKDKDKDKEAQRTEEGVGSVRRRGKTSSRRGVLIDTVGQLQTEEQSYRELLTLKFLRDVSATCFALKSLPQQLDGCTDRRRGQPRRGGGRAAPSGATAPRDTQSGHPHHPPLAGPSDPKRVHPCDAQSASGAVGRGAHEDRLRGALLPEGGGR
jgi:hypothetical protein